MTDRLDDEFGPEPSAELQKLEQISDELDLVANEVTEISSTLAGVEASVESGHGGGDGGAAALIGLVLILSFVQLIMLYVIISKLT